MCRLSFHASICRDYDEEQLKGLQGLLLEAVAISRKQVMTVKYKLKTTKGLGRSGSNCSSISIAELLKIERSYL